MCWLKLRAKEQPRMKNRHQRNVENNQRALAKIQHRKKFIANLKTVCNLYAGYDLYAKLPSFSIEKIYEGRLRGIVAKEGEGTTLESGMIETITFIIKELANSNFIELPNNKGKLSIALQLEEGFSLTNYIKHCKDDEFAAALEAKEALKPYDTEINYFNTFYATLYNMLTTIGVLLTDVSRGYVWVQHKFVVLKTMKSVFYVHDSVSPKEQFVVEGHSRPAYRVGWIYAGNTVEWCAIKPSQLGLPVGMADEPMAVYIQHHALLRLKERMGLETGMMHYALFHSIKSCQYYHDKNGSLLIAYDYLFKRAGYLVSTIENGKVLIHTFLFITNNGTPEGKKLSELTGLELMDKKYLAIDKLSTLLAYNIEENEFVKNIFVQAGCGHLIGKAAAKHFVSSPTNTVDAGVIAKYLYAHQQLMNDKKQGR
jgi:hypothetical protein